ncbi:MAG: FadR/GntR family transcriptional regulator [Chloroflexota bacterium]|nr:FadR/GntR family transcriptional regulator [Chloroflexota bacterium]
MMSRISDSSLVDRLVDELRHMILSGEVRPGDFLPSRKELAAHFGVGLSTVHEAVQVLSAVGVLDSRPGKGTWVRSDAMDALLQPRAVRRRLGELEAREVYEARFVIEVALTELAAQRATRSDVERIWQALDSMEAAVNDDQRFVEADLAFHLAVAQAGSNELLEQFYHISRHLLKEVIAQMVKLPRVKHEAIRIQRRIAEAVAQRDPERAREMAIEHRNHVEEILDTR